MKKSPKTISISIGVFFGVIFAAYAITSHFYRSDGERSDFDPGTIFRLVMPLAPSGESGLYNLNVDSNWGSEDARAENGQWVEVYRYGESLTPGASTTPLASKITMVDMELEEFVGLGDLNVEMTGYSCGTEDTGIDDAWSAISQYYGV